MLNNLNKEITYQSFGGGPPSVALLILNCQGIIQPKATVIIFADPGSEDPKTYELLPVYQKYAEQYNIPFITVSAKEGKLYDYIWNRSTPIPIYTSTGGLGHRQCTRQWKVYPINSYLRKELGASHINAQLGMTWEEVWRMRDSPVKYVTNVYPLIDIRIRREECIALIKKAELPVPPRSACIFCPFKSQEAWQEMAIHNPETFKEAVRLEERINARQDSKGKLPVYLTNRKRPLGQLGETWRKQKDLIQQLNLIPSKNEEDWRCESGHCFT